MDYTSTCSFGCSYEQQQTSNEMHLQDIESGDTGSDGCTTQWMY